MSMLRDLLNGSASVVPQPAPQAPAAGPIETAARAAAATKAAALAPTGSPEQDLANLLNAFEQNAGAAPRVNPPEAAKVLATKTAAEVKGVPEPEEDDGPEVEPPTSKPASVVAAEAAPRSRRTAAVVQQELDALIETHNKLSREHEALKTEVAGYADTVRAEFAAEAELGKADLAKAYARNTELEAELESFKTRAASVITALNERLKGQPAAVAVDAVPLSEDCYSLTPAALAERYSTLVLSKALVEQGWAPSLTVAT